MSYRVRFEQWVPMPLAEVFGFFSDPANLPRIMPPRLEAKLVRMRIVPPAQSTGRNVAGVGSEIVVSVRLFPLLPLRTRWVARITGFEMNRRFADVQEKGPFRRWEHQHEFEAAARDGREGTIVRDLIEYDVGLGIVGAPLERLFVGPEMRRTFAHRQRTLEDLLKRPGL